MYILAYYLTLTFIRHCSFYFLLSLYPFVFPSVSHSSFSFCHSSSPPSFSFRTIHTLPLLFPTPSLYNSMFMVFLQFFFHSQLSVGYLYHLSYAFYTHQLTLCINHQTTMLTRRHIYLTSRNHVIVFLLSTPTHSVTSSFSFLTCCFAASYKLPTTTANGLHKIYLNMY